MEPVRHSFRETSSLYTKYDLTLYSITLQTKNPKTSYTLLNDSVHPHDDLSYYELFTSSGLNMVHIL